MTVMLAPSVGVPFAGWLAFVTMAGMIGASLGWMASNATTRQLTRGLVLAVVLAAVVLIPQIIIDCSWWCCESWCWWPV